MPGSPIRHDQIAVPDQTTLGKATCPVMALPPEERLDREKVNEAVRKLPEQE
jgi:hypothetical protein